MQLIEQFHPIVNILIGFSLGAFLFLFFLFRKSKSDGAYEKEKEIFIQSTEGGEYIHQHIHQERLKREYLRGVEKGKDDERLKLSVKITPYIDIEDGIVWDTLYRGYTEQVIYDGFSIGKPSYHLIE
jgi:hypothetical protein